MRREEKKHVFPWEGSSPRLEMTVHPVIVTLYPMLEVLRSMKTKRSEGVGKLLSGFTYGTWISRRMTTHGKTVLSLRVRALLPKCSIPSIDFFSLELPGIIRTSWSFYVKVYEINVHCIEWLFIAFDMNHFALITSGWQCCLWWGYESSSLNAQIIPIDFCLELQWLIRTSWS